MKKRTTLPLVALLCACTTTTHYWSRPDLSKVEIGMTQQQVVSILGKPETVSATGGTTYLQYGWDDPWDGRIGAAEKFFVRIVEGKVDAFGAKGDFDSTKNPTIEIKKEIIEK